MKFHKAHSDFLNYLEVIKNKSEKTVEQYDRHLNKFSEYLEEKDLDSYNLLVNKIDLDLAE